MKSKELFILFLTVYNSVFASCFEQPWGKDAELTAVKPRCCPVEKPPSILTSFGVAAIRFHQEVISPADGPRSHFIPSSSQYTLDSMKKYGFFTGYMLGCDRLMRENEDPWVYRKTVDCNGQTMKYDPVK